MRKTMEMICITRTYMTYGSVVAKGGSVLNFAAAMHMRCMGVSMHWQCISGKITGV